MQFRLKTFFIVTTVVSVIVGFMILRHQRFQKLKAHYDSFELLQRAAGSLSPEIKKKLVSIPAVALALRARSQMVPENYISGGYGGTASIGTPRSLNSYFEYDYSFQWPDETGSYSAENSINIVVRSALDGDPTAAHILTLEYPDTEFNRIIADLIEELLAKDRDVKVQHQKSE